MVLVLVVYSHSKVGKKLSNAVPVRRNQTKKLNQFENEKVITTIADNWVEKLMKYDFKTTKGKDYNILRVTLTNCKCLYRYTTTSMSHETIQ